VQTKVCLQVTEKRYPETQTWQGFGRSAQGAEEAMDQVQLVFKRHDKEALRQLSDPILGRDPKQFDDQAKAYFDQMETGAITTISREYEFSGFVVFLARLHWMDKTFSSPFIFHQEENGAFGFLPYRTNDLTFQLLLDWLNAPWGPSNQAEPAYCSEATITDSNYRVPTSTSTASPVPFLLLNGAPATQSTDLVARTNATLQGMKKALAADDWIDSFVPFISPEGAKRLKEWYRTASEQDKIDYKQYIMEQDPFFVFNASPLVVVYTKTPANMVQIMYFMPSGGNLVWTNSTRVTVADKLFKSAELFKAAMLPKPFSNLEIQK
jgi:hypothetical protein